MNVFEAHIDKMHYLKEILILQVVYSIDLFPTWELSIH